MSIFNSLGSNYNLGFAIKALLGGAGSNLKELLERRYGGQTVLLFKGRQTITLALKSLELPKDSEIVINGFTCYAVYKAIKEAGCRPVLIDIPKDDLNFSPQALKEKFNNKTKAVIVQNTLGYPCDIEEITKICKEKGLILIEDIAHSAGSVYKNGKQVGTVGDITILSFSQDKIIDGISGGALIIRNSEFRIQNSEFSDPSLKKQVLDCFYPLLTLLIRSTYNLGMGKLLHYLLKKTNVLSMPMDDSLYGLISLPKSYQSLALYSLENLKNDIGHRRKIAKIYKENLPSEILFEKITSLIDSSSNLRFPIFLDNCDGLIRHLRNNGFHLSDIWYDAPISPKRFMEKVDYGNDCPNAQEISQKIVNLPTHKNISEKQALYLSKLITEWLR